MTIVKSGSISDLEDKPETSFGAERIESVCFNSVSACVFWTSLLRPEGLEPPTTGSEDRCSVQLSYGRNDSTGIEKSVSQPHDGARTI